MNTPPPATLPPDLVPLWEEANNAETPCKYGSTRARLAASCDPDTIRSLLSTIAAQRAEVERAKSQTDFICEVADGYQKCILAHEERLAALEAKLLDLSKTNVDLAGELEGASGKMLALEAELATTKQAVETAVKAEREACAKVVENWDCSCAMTCQCHFLVAAIRARGETQGGQS